MANELQEFSRNYEYCFFHHKLKVSGRPRAFLLTGIKQGDDIAVGKIITEGLQEKAETLQATKLMQEGEPVIVSRGFINTSCIGRPTALFLDVGHDRQYRKALCLQGSDRVWCLPNGSMRFLEELRASGPDGAAEQQRLIKAVAHQLVQDKTPAFPFGFRGAIDQVITGRSHSVAISKFFAVSLCRNIAYPVVWHRTKWEGVVIKDCIYATENLLPFAGFFEKKWNIPMKEITKAKV